MSALTLTLRQRPTQPVDVSPLTPDHLAGRSASQMEAVELVSGNRRVRVDELFAVEGRFTSEIRFRGACDRLDRIGEGMTHGRIVVEGAAGAFAGAGMRGGHIEIHGSAGAWAAAGMRGGMLRIDGNAGDFLAAALPGDHQGLQGGTVWIGGSAGDRAGDRMRRGMLLIEGDTGDYPASRMVAGTMAVGGRVGRSPGLGMRRGTLLLRHTPKALPPTFNDCGTLSGGFLVLLIRSWRGLPGTFGNLPTDGLQVRRLMGDVANDGRGEILVPA